LGTTARYREIPIKKAAEAAFFAGMASVFSQVSLAGEQEREYSLVPV